MHIHVPRFSFKALALIATGLCGLGGAVQPSAAHAQASVLLKHQQTSAIVETVDREAREVLLREDNGHLITIEYGSGINDLPHLHEGDHLLISFVETLGADMAPPGSPLPESTLTTARGFAHGHPRGVIAAFNRERATIQSISLKTHSVAFVTDDGALHVAVLHTKAMQDFLATLKVGDVVDMTRMESISYVITNETQPAPKAPAAAPVSATPAPSAPAAPAPAAQ